MIVNCELCLHRPSCRPKCLCSIGLAFFAAFFATANQQIGEEILINDNGGTFYIHTFGAVFGLFASRFIFDKTTSEKHSNAEPRSTTAGNLGFIAVPLVLAIYPVFNSGLISYTIYASKIKTGASFGSVDAVSTINAFVFRSYFNTLFAGQCVCLTSYCVYNLPQ